MIKLPRYYPTPEGMLPSVTTILGILAKPLDQWAANCAADYLAAQIDNREPLDFEAAKQAHNQISGEARAFGTEVHEMCELYNRGRNPHTEGVYSEEAVTLFEGYKVWFEKHNVKPIAIESMVWSHWERAGYAGRLDLLAEVDGKVCIVDLKTGKGSYYPEWRYQCAGYRAAWNRRNEVKAVGTVIVKFNKETMKVNSKDFSESYMLDLSIMTHITELYWMMNKTQIEKAQLGQECEVADGIDSEGTSLPAPGLLAGAGVAEAAELTTAHGNAASRK
jgi:hypothetical protein